MQHAGYVIVSGGKQNDQQVFSTNCTSAYLNSTGDASERKQDGEDTRGRREPQLYVVVSSQGQINSPCSLTVPNGPKAQA